MRSVNQNSPLSKRVIIAEDNDGLRSSIVKYLRREKIDIVGVATAREFYDQAAEDSFVLAIVDIGLPQQKRHHLIKYLRKSSLMGIVVLTTHSSLYSAYNSGADYCLIKPLDMTELSFLIINYLNRIDAVTDSNTWSASWSHKKRLSLDADLNSLSPITVEKNTTHWKIVQNGCVLIDPQDNAIKLTVKEFQLMHMLAIT